MYVYMYVFLIIQTFTMLSNVIQILFLKMFETPYYFLPQILFEP